MLPDRYLTVTLLPLPDTDTIPETDADVFLLTAPEQADDYAFPARLSQRVKRAMEEQKNEVLTVLGDITTLVAMVTQHAPEKLRLLGAKLREAIQCEKVSSVFLHGLEPMPPENRYALLEGVLLSSYQFSKYKKEPADVPVKLYLPDTFFSAASVAQLTNLTWASSLVKSLVNEPLNQLDAPRFAEIAVSTGQACGFGVEVLHKEEIETLGMGGLLAVNQGSATPPTFTILTHRPDHAVNEKPLVLVGKGVMFDTGGYSLKVGGSMPTMKSDMAGGAAVLGIVAAAALNSLPYHVIGLIPATDNKISANALVVDDVITMMDGTTVEVLNTDAEGRLILADALTYAKRFAPELVIDMATLTGASAAITGPYGIAMAGNDQRAMDKLKETGELVYERLCQLPFWPEFADLLKSKLADLQNIGGPTGGASTAGKFLEHFTDYPWIHLDIAGAAYIKEANGYQQAGGTGVPVRLLYEFVMNRCAEK